MRLSEKSNLRFVSNPNVARPDFYHTQLLINQHHQLYSHSPFKEYSPHTLSNGWWRWSRPLTTTKHSHCPWARWRAFWWQWFLIYAAEVTRVMKCSLSWLTWWCQEQVPLSGKLQLQYQRGGSWPQRRQDNKHSILGRQKSRPLALTCCKRYYYAHHHILCICRHVYILAWKGYDSLQHVGQLIELGWRALWSSNG